MRSRRATWHFTVDQQQYLQGYLPVILMYLQATNQNTAGGGLPILTGPGFVDTANASVVKTAGFPGNPLNPMTDLRR